MRRKKPSETRLLSILLTTALFLTAGCGPGGSLADAASPKEDEFTEETSDASDALRVCVVDTQVRYSEEARGIFQAKYPDVNVELEIVPFENLEEEKTRISSELMAGEGCDLYINVDYLLEDPYKAQQAGAFADLVPLFRQYTDLGEEDFMPGTFDGLENGEECYILPLTQSFSLLVIRKDMQEELGISPDTWSGPEDLNRCVATFYEKYPQEHALSLYESLYPSMENYGFRIWKEKENIRILKESDWQNGLDMEKRMLYPEGTYIGMQPDNTVEGYRKMEREEEKRFSNEVMCMGKLMIGFYNQENYIRMGGEEGADLFPEYDAEGKILTMGMTGVAIPQSSNKKEEAIHLVQELVRNYVAVGVTGTTWKEGNDILLENLRKEFGSGEVNIEGTVYPGLTETTFEKLEQWIDQAEVYYPVYVELGNGIYDRMEPYLTGEKAYEECMKEVEEFMEIYFSE